MPEFTIRHDGMARLLAELERSRAELGDCVQAAKTVSFAITGQASLAGLGYDQMAAKAGRQLSQTEESLKRIAITLRQVDETYAACEYTLLNGTAYPTTGQQMLNTALPFIKGMGTLGKLAAVLGNLGTNGDWKSFAGAMKDTYGLVKGWVKDAAKAGTPLREGEYRPSWAEKLVGGADYFKSLGIDTVEAGAGTGSTFLKLFNEVGGEELKKAAKWSVLLSAGINGIGNYAEWKSGEISGKRAVAETITETAFDLALGAVLTAGTAAVLGTVCAPTVLLVGLGVAGGKLALNGMAKWASGGEVTSMTELVSDAALDLVMGKSSPARPVSMPGNATSAGWLRDYAAGGGSVRRSPSPVRPAYAAGI